jgi:hypothetical protein
MEHYCVGLDVSLKLTAICIVDRTRKIQREMRRMSRGSDSNRSDVDIAVDRVE